MPNPNFFLPAFHISVGYPFAKTRLECRTASLGCRFGIFFLVLALGLFPPGIAHAQTATGSIIGTITDSTGAVVSGAAVTAKSTSTGTTQTRTTTASGTYS